MCTAILKNHEQIDPDMNGGSVVQIQNRATMLHGVAARAEQEFQDGCKHLCDSPFKPLAIVGALRYHAEPSVLVAEDRYAELEN